MGRAENQNPHTENSSNEGDHNLTRIAHVTQM